MKLKLDGVGTRGRAALRVDADGAWCEPESRGARKAKIDLVQEENARLNASLFSARKLLGQLDRCGALSAAKSEAAQAVATALELKKEAEWKASAHASTARRDKQRLEVVARELESSRAAEAKLRQELTEAEGDARQQLAAMLQLRKQAEKEGACAAEKEGACATEVRELKQELADAASQQGYERAEHRRVSEQLQEVAASLAELQVTRREQEAELEQLRGGEVDFDFLADAVGVPAGRRSLPTRDYADSDTSTSSATWMRRTIKHISAVLRGRPLPLVARSLVALGLERECGKGASLSVVRELSETPPFAQLHKETAMRTVDLTQDHWTARLSVHLQTRLDLSRDGMDILRHLLSFIYNPTTDTYDPIKVWVNPSDSSDCVETAHLVGRTLREREYRSIAKDCGVTVCATTGRCERDTRKVSEEMYCKYASAMRSNFSKERPAQPVFYIDATGSGLGRGLTHAEMGSADFVGNVFQSRSSMQPLAGYEGSDKGASIRANLPNVMPSFNSMVTGGYIAAPAALKEQYPLGLPVRPLVAADMQAIKALMGMCDGCHSVWCWCLSEQQHIFPDGEMHTWADVLAFYRETGCYLKTERDCCELAHYSYGVHRGVAFTPVKCRLCGYECDTEEVYTLTPMCPPLLPPPSP